MPKRKKVKNGYGNVYTDLMLTTYLNKWACVVDEYGKLQEATILIKAEGGSLIQLILSKNELYNGIYHITKFKQIKKKDIETIIVEDLDVIHDSKDQSFEALKSQLPDILVKYQAEKVDSIDSLPLDVCPLNNLKTLPKIMFE